MGLPQVSANKVQPVALASAAAIDPEAAQKKVAAEAAVNNYVKSGMKLGIGTGSTVKFAVDALGARLKSGQLKNIVAASTSDRTTAQAKSLGIAVKDLKALPKLDLDIDGADEVAKVGNQFLITKGGGGA